MSLQYHWRVGNYHRKFVPKVCKAILEEFQQELRRNLETHGMYHNAVGAQDGKHIAMEKPKNSGNEYFTYKGYFSVVLLALVDAEYKFVWVNVGSSGSSSDAQIFNRSRLNIKIENGTLGLPPPEPQEPGGPNLYHFLLRERFLCCHALAGQALQQKTTDQGGENSQLRDIQRQEGGQLYFLSICRKVQGTADHHGAKARSCERHCVDMCGTTQHAKKISGWSRQATNPSRRHTTPTG